MKPPPLGAGASGRLAFQPASALDRDFTALAREVVAFLNHRGGVLWIGVRARAGKVAAYESVADAAASARHLRDRMADAIEPRPEPREVSTSVIRAPTGAALLAVRARPAADRQPYAFLARGARTFVQRSGSRARTMERDEIRASFLRSASHGAEPSERSALLARARAAAAPRRVRELPRFALALVPSIGLALDLPAQRVLLEDPAKSGNRPRAFTVFSESGEWMPTRDILEVGAPANRSLRLHRDGLLAFECRGEFLLEGYRGTRLFPFAVLELPTSFLRLARAILKTARLRPAAELAFVLTFEGASGWTLSPHSPQSLASTFATEAHPVPGDLAIETTFAARELVATSDDRCALRVVQRLYGELGYSDQEVPREFDPRTGVLRMEG